MRCGDCGGGCRTSWPRCRATTCTSSRCAAVMSCRVRTASRPSSSGRCGRSCGRCGPGPGFRRARGCTPRPRCAARADRARRTQKAGRPAKRPSNAVAWPRSPLVAVGRGNTPRPASARSPMDPDPTTPPDDVLRAGVIGVGWAGRQHIAAYDAMPGVELAVIAGLEEAERTELAARHGVERDVARWEDLLETEGLDVVSIAVPTFLHARIALAAFERGLHVLCEKPIARTVEEATEMVAAARAAERVLEVAFNHRRR